MNQNLILKKSYNFAKVMLLILKLFVLNKIKNANFLKIKSIKLDTKIHILANGPSLKDNLKIINKKTDQIVMVNYSILTEFFEEYKPKFIVLADPKFFGINTPNLEKNKIKRLYEKLELIDYEINLVIPSYLKKNIDIKNPHIKLIFVNENYINIKNEKIRNKLLENNVMGPYLINVSILSLYSSIQMGYNEIYMHGIDSDWYKNFEINNKNEIIIRRSYFYGEVEENLTKDKNMKKGDFYKLLLESSNLLEQYKILNNYAYSQGVKILNCSKKSVVDSLERL